MKIEIRKTETKRINLPDDTVLDHIWRSLWNEETIRDTDIQDISVIVDSGQVCLSGHVSKDDNNQRIEEITRLSPGVTSVHNHLVTDHSISNQVVQAIGEFESTRPFSLPVTCNHGWVELGGVVPDREIQCTVEVIAASIAPVRGVVLLPSINGEAPFQKREAGQPRIGVRVFGKDETQGLVYKVVVTPQNRLVTHAIVRVNRSGKWWQDSCDYLLPIEHMDVVGPSGILLNLSTPAIHELPVFPPADYPFAPLTWQPPYPYKVGDVRWPRIELGQVEQRTKVNVGKAGTANNFRQPVTSS